MRLPCKHKARKDNSSGNTNLRLMKIEQTKQKERRNSSSSVTNAMSPVTKVRSAHRKIQERVLGKKRANIRKGLELLCQ
jgi:hypothetical protein